MKKLRLDLADLKIQSFAPAAAGEALRRAVRGFDGTLGQPCQSICWCVIGWSDASCPDWSCSCAA